MTVARRDGEKKGRVGGVMVGGGRGWEYTLVILVFSSERLGFSLIPYIVNYFRCTSFPVEILAARARFNESSVLLGVTWINK